jgi:hypothetical protein
LHSRKAVQRVLVDVLAPRLRARGWHVQWYADPSQLQLIADVRMHFLPYVQSDCRAVIAQTMLLYAD